MKEALCNSVEDFNKNVKELVSEKISLKNSFIQAHIHNNFNKVLFIVEKSKACNKILSLTLNPAKIDALNKQIQDEDVSLKISMKVLNLLINRCYLKALQTISYN